LLIILERELLQQANERRFTAAQRWCQMTNFDEQRLMIRRNKLLGIWVAEKLGLKGEDADAYSDGLAMDAVDPERSDVLKTIRQDFQANGVVQSDEQILRVMNDTLIRAARQLKTRRGDSQDAATLMIARNLTSR
jgi:hypothetical protein